MKKIVLAGGCFWGVEAYFKKIHGVKNTKVGYSNGHTKDPTYKEVCTSITGYAEVCYIEYDENIINLNNLLKKFFRIIDPTLINRQGPDIGSQYRTGIYYYEDDDLDIINTFIDQIKDNYNKKIVTEVDKINNFYEAEEYHQNYLDKNPHGYCHIDLNNI
ncbi:MAG: peptide-methionine (S)-S-oxide reductase MsrA [Peptostreptococcaceae bacterium]|jgi:peptide-methionine (S)-S-oxide reductase|nr:peptide-methionine (S)-S-oxide reductase MsrA [Peptostreptococcaceae bacterium]